MTREVEIFPFDPPIESGDLSLRLSHSRSETRLRLTEAERRAADEVAGWLAYNDRIAHSREFRATVDGATIVWDGIPYSFVRADIDGKISRRFDPMSAGGVLECREGVVTGVKNAPEVHSRRGFQTAVKNMPSGYMEASDFEQSNPFLETFYRELHEEVGYSPEDIDGPSLLGVSKDLVFGGYSMSFAYRVDSSFEEVEDKWRHSKDKAENDRLVLTAKGDGELHRFIRTEREVVPGTLGGLLLYGRSLYGPDWLHALVAGGEDRFVETV